MNGVGQVDLLFLNLLMEFKMKYKTFKKSINNLFNFYISTRNFDKDLEKVFGGDSMIMTDWWNIPLEEGLDIIAKDMKDKTGVVDWLFFESLLSTKGMTFEINEVRYDGTIKNVWLDLKGKLKPKHGTRITNDS